MIAAFFLNMPNVASWNGRWSGEGKCYAIVKNFGTSKKAVARCEEIIKNGGYSYNFGDDWCARVDVEAVDSAEARRIRKRSSGFCGYNWMVDSILLHGEIKAEP